MATVNNEMLDEEVKESELLRKNDITLFSRAADEIKDFTFVIRTMIIKFYQTNLKIEDISALAEDILKLTINLVVSDEIYKILLILCRVETFSLDKGIREKYLTLRNCTPEDFGVDTYLTLNNASPIVEEITK